MSERTTIRCDAVVYHRDTYRYTGRTKGGFEMHYNRCQCSRRAVGGDLCRQHSKVAVSSYVERWSARR